MTSPERASLRVAMTTARYLPDGGGTAIHTYEVARRLVEAGIDVTIVTTTFRRADTRATLEDGIKIVRVRAWPRRTDYYFAPGIVRVLRRERFDLVHCQGYHTLVAPLTMLTARIRRIPYVLTFHSGGHSSPMRGAVRTLQARLLRPLIRRSAARIAVSEFEADLFAARLGIPRSDLTVIPSGVELPGSHEAGPVTVEPLIVSIGRLEHYKGHHRVVEALPVVRAARPEMRVRIAGSGPTGSALRELARSLGVEDAVDIGPVATGSRTKLAELLRRASVVVALSEYESQGLAAHEALALGRPLVVNDSTALRELAVHPGVRAVAPTAPPAQVAAAILDAISAPPGPPVPFPTWADCVTALLDVYRNIGIT